jgi:hypothetical protein
VAESGNSPTSAFVTVTDELKARNYTHSFIQRGLVSDPYDYNKDSYVTVTDELLARNNATSFLDALRLITVPSVSPSPGPEDASLLARFERDALHDTVIAELDTERESLAHADRYVPALPWLDALDLPAAQGRPSKIAAPALAAVEKLLATL